MKDCDALSRMAYIEYDPKKDTHPMDHKDMDDIEEDDTLPLQRGKVLMLTFPQEKRDEFPGPNVATVKGGLNYPTPTPTIIQAQMEDDLVHDIRCVVEERMVDCKNQASKWIKKVKKLATIGFIEENVLFHMSGPLGRRIWVPESLIPLLLHEMHDALTAGHMGTTRTLQRASVNYYWKGMRRTIQDWVLSCPKCQVNNEDPHMRVRTDQREGPYPTRPFERLNMDIVGPFPESTAGYKHILTISDLGTRWVEVYPLKKLSAEYVAGIFLQQFCLKYGPPKSILTDQGGTFMAKVFAEVCRLTKTQQNVSSAYHAQTNGVTERTHKVFHNILKKTVDFHNSNWDEMIHFAAHAYRTTPHALTGHTPFYLVFGYECLEFVDIALQPNAGGATYPRTWVQQREQMIAKMQVNYSAAWKKIASLHEDQEGRQTAPLREFVEGTLVYIRNFTKGDKRYGGGKVRKWKRQFIGPYVIQLSPIFTTPLSTQ